MPATKDDVVNAIRESQQEIEKVAMPLAPQALSKRAYEQGWNVKQLIRHLASTSGMAGFVIGLARAPVGSGLGASFDVDSWSAEQVAARRDKPVSELLAEFRLNCERDISTVKAAPDDLLAKEIRAPWGAEGRLGDIIVQSIQGHFGMHLADLRSAVA